MNRLLTTKATAAIAVFLLTFGGAAATASVDAVGDPSRAVFEGDVLDLAEGWGEAGACAEFGVIVECFRTEAELLAAHPELGSGAALAGRSPSSAAALASTCGTSLRLYRSTGHSGGALYLTTRQVVHNLSSDGFDNDTSSYTVGACASAFYSGSNLGGSQYPGSTAAYASASAMVSGWNNVVSSVIIY